jgi:hypothetical protein
VGDDKIKKPDKDKNYLYDMNWLVPRETVVLHHFEVISVTHDFVF